MEQETNNTSPIFYVGKGYWHDDNWVDVKGKKVGIPTIDSNVILDERCISLKVGYKPFYNILYYIFNAILYPSMRGDVGAYIIRARKIIVIGGNVKFVTPTKMSGKQWLQQKTSDKHLNLDKCNN